MSIESVTFDRAIQVDHNRRIDRFESHTWSIVEVEPGRISLIEVLRVKGPNIIVQDLAYTLVVVEDPAPEPEVSPTEDRMVTPQDRKKRGR